MGGEFQHKDAGAALSQAEDNAIDRHQFEGQATGDMLYASSATQLSRKGIGNTNDVLKVVGGVPVWGPNPDRYYPQKDANCILYLPLYEYPLRDSPFDSMDANAHVVTVTGAVWSPAYPGRDSDGVDDRFSVADSSVFANLTAFSLEAQIKQDIQGYEAIISKDSGVAGGREWLLALLSTGKLFFTFFNNVTAYLETTGTLDVSDGAWHRVAVSWDGTNAIGHTLFYVDGVSDAVSSEAKSGLGAVPYDGAYPIEVGRMLADNTYCWDGKQGEFIAYNDVRTPAEIMNDYLATKWRYE